MQILILFYVVANAVGVENPSSAFSLSLFAGAYLAEMVPRRHRASAIRSSNRRAPSASRGTDLPLRHLPAGRPPVYPAADRQFASIIKDSSSLSIIA